MKTIIFYGRTQMGVVVLQHLLIRGFRVKVIPEDDLVQEMCRMHNLEEVTLDTMGEFDLFLCCHGEKIIKEKYLNLGTFVNMHSCLWKYKGKDPIDRYIKNKDTEASIESHYMSPEVDGGAVIERVLFTTPIIETYGEYFNLALSYYIECIEKTLRKLWKTAAFTRILDDPQRLELWLSYYSKYFDDLCVICYGKKEPFQEQIKKYNISFSLAPQEGRTAGGFHSLNSLALMKKKQKELLKNHEWVLYSDADEFVIPDPKKYRGLRDFMDKTTEEQTFCDGYEIFKESNEVPIDYTKPILMQRKYWTDDENASYSKPLLSRIPSDWTHGFHKLASMTDQEIREKGYTGLYLVHLRDVDNENIDHREFQKSIIPNEIRRFL